MQRRSTTAAAATPDIAVVRFAAVDLLGDVLGKTCRLHTGPIAIERRIVTRAGINVVADMSAIGFDHVAAQPHDHGKTTHELTHHARENLLMASMRAFKRSEEHTSELQSLMRISYAVFCLKKKNLSS